MDGSDKERSNNHDPRGWFSLWFSQSHLRAVCFILASVAEAIMAGLLGGVLTFAFLDSRIGATTFIGGLVLFTLVVVVRILRIRYEGLGQTTKAQTAKRAHIITGALVALAVSVTILVQMYSLGFWPFRVLGTGEAAYKASFERITSAMKSIYPYFQMKGINWDDLTSQYKERLGAVKSDKEYIALLAEMLATLNDGHTGVNDPWPGADLKYLANVRVIEGKPVITAVRKTIDIEGFKPGATILARDGVSVDEWVSSLPLPMRSASTPWGSKAKAYSFLCAIPENGQNVITYLTPQGETLTKTFEWKPEYFGTPSLELSSDPAGKIVKGKMLPSGVGIITVNQLWGSSNLVKEFDKVLNGMMDAKGIILDLRQNGGGNSLYGDAMANRFMSRHFTYGKEYFRRRLFTQAFTKESSYYVRPRETVYKGPLVVLTDVDTFSSAELMTSALKDSGRAVTLGRTTGGGSGNPIQIKVPGGHLRFSTGDFRRMDGSPIEGKGIVPDIPIEWTVEDVVKGNDPDIAAAERYILGQ